MGDFENKKNIKCLKECKYVSTGMSGAWIGKIKLGKSC